MHEEKKRKIVQTSEEAAIIAETKWKWQNIQGKSRKFSKYYLQQIVYGTIGDSLRCTVFAGIVLKSIPSI